MGSSRPAHDLAVLGGQVVTPRGRSPLDLYSDGGRVTLLATPDARRSAKRVIDATGCLVLPGMVDSHVHFMDPGDSTREDFIAGSSAAALNGVTTVVEHTHSWPVNTRARLIEKRRHLEGRSSVDFGLAAHVWPDHLDELEGMWREGIAFFKAFTCETHGIPASLSDTLFDTAEILGDLGAPCLVHCEDDLITARNERRLRSAMRVDGGVIPEWRSREAEIVATGAVALTAKVTGARFIVAHASNPEVLRLIVRERREGASIVAESCPQYMRLHEDEVHEAGAFRKFTPPARIRSDQEEADMWNAFNSGLVNHISSDHAPATREQKLAGDIWEVHFGLPGIDTTLPLMLDAASRGRTSFERVVEAYAEAPARTYGLAAKGRLVPGGDADIVVYDPQGERLLSDERVCSRAGWTPYAGVPVRGTVRATLVRGSVVVEDGALVEGERVGQFVPGPGFWPDAD